MTKNLIVLDDEFGGLAIKDVRDFKKMADTNIIDMRLPYGTLYSKFKRISFDSNITLQKLVNRSVNKYIEDEDFRNEINNYTELQSSGSQF
jgi:hypothetical protein